MPLSKVLEKTINARVSGILDFSFEVKNEGFFLIKIVARAGAWWQQLPVFEGKYWMDEELKVFLDEKPIETYFNGNSLYGTRQFIFLFERLLPGKHSLNFKSKGKPLLEAVEVGVVTDGGKPLDITSLIENNPEDTLLSSFVSRKKNWINLISWGPPFLYLLVNARARNGRQLLFWQTDDGDLQLKLGGEVQKNSEPKSHPFWYWCGRASKGVRKIFEGSFTDQNSIHKIGLVSDRRPEVDRVLISFRRIPTIGDPRWTDNFDSDTDVMLLARLIFGEAENQPRGVKIGVGFTVLNRLKKKKPNWGLSVREIILKENQYDGLWNKNTYDKVRDPLHDAGEKRLREWHESYEVSAGILAGRLSDTAFGSTNFHSFKRKEDFPFWATDSNFKVKLGDIYFYGLEE